MNRTHPLICLILGLALFGVSGLEAYAIEVSFEDDVENLGPDADLDFEDQDIASFDGTTLFQLFDGDIFTDASDEDIDALHIGPSGVVYFSTRSRAVTGDGSITFGDADVIRYDPNVEEGSAFSVFFDGRGRLDLDAFSIQGSKIYVSFRVNEGADDQTVGSNDLVISDSQVYALDIAESGITLQDSSAAELVLDAKALFTNFEDTNEDANIRNTNGEAFDVDAFAVLDDGTFLFSLESGLNFETDESEFSQDSGFIYEYDPNDPEELAFDPLDAGIFLDSSAAFGVDVDVDALNVIPEPTSLAFILAGAGLVTLPRRRQRSNAVNR